MKIKFVIVTLLFAFIASPVAADTTTTTIYPSKFYNTDGVTETKHIFANGEEVGNVSGTGTEAVTRYVHTDQLTSSNIVTNALGDIDETLDYFPFGSLRMDSGPYSDQRKFIGQEYDSDTGLNYLNSRYYDSSIGKFISEDPSFLGLKFNLDNPQETNSYSYAGNNPITGSDPTGLYTIIIPGTWYNSSGWNNSKNTLQLQSWASNQFGETPVLINNKGDWSGGDNNWARSGASYNISNLINDHKFTDGEKLNIIGHSHGGNIAFEVSNEIDRKIDNLVTLATPITNDYKPNIDNIGNFVNAYSKLDLVQVNGGAQFTHSGLIGSLLAGPIGEKIGNMLGFGQFGHAGRTIQGAMNLNVTKEASKLPWATHSSLWTSKSVLDRVSQALNRK